MVQSVLVSRSESNAASRLCEGVEPMSCAILSYWTWHGRVPQNEYLADAAGEICAGKS